MDPVSMGGVGLATSALGGLFGASGQEQEAQAKSQMYQYQAGVADINKQIALQNADYSIRTGEVEAQQSGMKTRAQLGQARAIQSGSGLDVNSGSTLNVREGIEAVGAENTAVVRGNAAKRAYNYNVEAEQEGQKATMARMAAGNASRAGDIGAIGSLLGTAGSVASKWSQGSQAGIFGSSSTSSTGHYSGDSWE